MIFLEPNPIEALRNSLPEFGFSPLKNSGDVKEIQFSPCKVDDFAVLFKILTDEPVETYLPAEYTVAAKGLLITSLQAHQEEDDQRGGLRLTMPDSGLYQLEFAVVWTKPWTIADKITIRDSFIAFTITFSQESGLSVSAVIGSEKIKFLDYDLDLDVSVHVPSFLIEARLKTDQGTAGDAPAKMAEEYLGSLKKAGTDAIFIEDIRLSAAPFLKNYLLHLTVDNVLNLHNKFRIERFQAEISYRGSASEYGILAYTDIEIGFEAAPLVITLVAQLERSEGKTKWRFSGGIDHPIKVSRIIADLAQLFGENGTSAENPYHLPAFIADTELIHLGFSFEIESGKQNSEQDYTFTLGLVVPLEERDVQLEIYAHYRKEGGAYKLELTGALSLDGFQLGVAFAKSADGQGKSDTTILGSLQTPLKLDSTDLIRAIAPSLADDVPISVDIELLGLLLAMHSGSAQPQLPAPSGATAQKPTAATVNKSAAATAQREYLFRLSFNIDIGLDGLPLIGKMLKDVRFKDGQLLAASRDWQNEHIADVNKLLGLITPPPPAIAAPQQSNATVGVGKGITLSGTFHVAEGVDFPLFLQFGGDKQQKQPPGTVDDKTPDKVETPAKKTAAAATAGSPKGQPDKGSQSTIATAKPAPAAAAAPASSPQGKSDERSQSKIDKLIGAVRIKKVALIFENERIGLKITGGLALAAFEFELMGMQVTVPQSVLDDPSKVSEIAFSLDGFGVKIQKGTLSILGGFLRQHYKEEVKDGKTIAAYDEFSGIIQVAFPPFNLAGMGSYALYNGHTSLFLFVALGFPIPVHPSLVITGMALGFGIHRDFIPPQPQDVLSYPLVAVAVTPPPPIDIQQMAEAMHKYFPPADDLYFVVVGVKFKAFGLVDSLVMAAVKFGSSFEIDLIGVSSILFPTAFIELMWTARFVPESGYLSIGGQLSERSYLLVPQVQITGGFAVAAWLAGEHKGDFVVSVGGYHPTFHVPDHYPNHIPRLGISFHLGPADIKGGMYFAITPQCVMMGGSLEASLTQGNLSAFIKLALDAIIFFEPFHYDLLISADAGVKVDLPLVLMTLHINMHLHIDMHIWGPEFSGTASLDVGVKTFQVAIGAAAENRALPISYETFKTKFLSTVCTVSVTEGLLRKAKENGVQIYVVDAEKVVIEARSTVPITDGKDASLGIVPMDVRGGKFSAKYALSGDDNFKRVEIRDSVPAGLWGGDGLTPPDLTDPASGLIKDVLTGYRLTPGAQRITSETHEIEKENLAYNTDVLTLKDCAVNFEMVEHDPAAVEEMPTETYPQYTGLNISDISPIGARGLLQPTLLTYALS